VRLFVAIELAAPVRAALTRVQQGLAGKCRSVRWIPSEQLHVTLKFLGEVVDADVLRVGEATTRAAARCAALEMSLVGCGCFPPRGNVRIAWVGIEKGAEPMSKLAVSLDEQFAELGFAPERRPFSPHITIGRVREGQPTQGVREALAAFSFPGVAQSVDRIVLMSSVLSPRGPTYAVVREAPLSG